jgi:hypothetical protein
MNPRVKLWVGTAAAGLVAAGLAFGTGANSSGIDAAQASMTGTAAKRGAPASAPSGGKPVAGVAQAGSGNGI